MPEELLWALIELLDSSLSELRMTLLDELLLALLEAGSSVGAEDDNAVGVDDEERVREDDEAGLLLLDSAPEELLWALIELLDPSLSELRMTLEEEPGVTEEDEPEAGSLESSKEVSTHSPSSQVYRDSSSLTKTVLPSRFALHLMISSKESTVMFAFLDPRSEPGMTSVEESRLTLFESSEVALEESSPQATNARAASRDKASEKFLCTQVSSFSKYTQTSTVLTLQSTKRPNVYQIRMQAAQKRAS